MCKTVYKRPRYYLRSFFITCVIKKHARHNIITSSSLELEEHHKNFFLLEVQTGNMFPWLAHCNGNTGEKTNRENLCGWHTLLQKTPLTRGVFFRITTLLLRCITQQAISSVNKVEQVRKRIPKENLLPLFSALFHSL